MSTGRCGKGTRRAGAQISFIWQLRTAMRDSSKSCTDLMTLKRSSSCHKKGKDAVAAGGTDKAKSLPCFCLCCDTVSLAQHGAEPGTSNRHLHGLGSGLWDILH